MIQFDFEYERPGTLAEAVMLLRRHGADARIMAGGTDLLPNMRVEVVRPAAVIGLSGITPEPPRCEADGSIRIDALTRLATIADSELIRKQLPLLAESARVVASNQIRQMGTLGGNLCQETRCLYLNQQHDYQFVAPCYKRGGAVCYPFPLNKPDVCWSVYMSDVAPALIALGADIETVDENGGRRIAVEDLFTGSGLNPVTLREGEIISAIIVPPAADIGWGYHKSARRGGLEFAMAVMAVTLRLAADRRTCSDARIVIGAVRERPVRAAAAERILVGAALDEAGIGAAIAAAVEELKPLPHHGFSKSYIVDNIRVYLRRVLMRAARAAGVEIPTA
ncbi:MAG: 4-hydroxybenzoyl-CoA reductase subunit beta [Pseudorhodoplanes sp.]|nr:MAG: 4-hydroxybenzoyl-CoA reductase subunit beta [Pseudorhodoplanes sp.]